MPPAYVDPCRGHFPHRQAAGCCPIQITAANRVVTNGVRPATTGSYLPMDVSQAIDSSDLRFLNQVDHQNDAGFDVPGATVEELMDATQAGIVDGATAIADLARRIPGAATADDRGILTASITALKALMDTGIVLKSSQASNGNLLKLWGLAVKRASTVGGPISKALEPDVADIEAISSDMTRTSKSILQIRRADNEQVFDTAVYMWSTLAHALGIMPLEISSHFIFEVVFSTRLKYKENFWTTQEYLVDCLDLIDRDVCKASVVANHDRNLMIDKARRLGAGFASVMAKKVVNPNAVPVEGGGVAWNGRFQPTSSKANCCPAFNRNKAHDNPKFLTADGTCRFRHVCNHWVTDKGPSGRCHNQDHGWHNFTNPNKCYQALA